MAGLEKYGWPHHGREHHCMTIVCLSSNCMFPPPHFPYFFFALCWMSSAATECSMILLGTFALPWCPWPQS
jgi:hypothetical protein